MQNYWNLMILHVNNNRFTGLLIIGTFEKRAPELFSSSLGASLLDDAASPRNISIDKKKYPLEPRVTSIWLVSFEIRRLTLASVRMFSFNF